MHIRYQIVERDKYFKDMKKGDQDFSCSRIVISLELEIIQNIDLRI